MKKQDAKALTFVNPIPIKWGDEAVQPVVPTGYTNELEMGVLSYVKSADDTQAVITNGVVSQTKNPGSITVTVNAAGGTLYDQGEVGTYTITVMHKDAPTVEITDPGMEEWGTNILGPTTPAIHNETHMGALQYTINNMDGTRAQLNPLTGEIKDANKLVA